MLVITHKVGDTMRLTLEDGRHLYVTLLEPDQRGRARLGIKAPREVRVERQDLWMGTGKEEER